MVSVTEAQVRIRSLPLSSYMGSLIFRCMMAPCQRWSAGMTGRTQWSAPTG